MGLTTASGEASVTIVVVPREKYGREARLVDQLVRLDGPAFELVVVDEAHAPRRLQRRLRAARQQHRFRHVALGHHAGANECRMRGFDDVTTPYVLFLDNDAELAAGALAALVDCAEETGAAFVAPVYVNTDGTIHYAGGSARIVDDADGRRLVEHHTHRGLAVEVRPGLRREPTDAPELHAVLVRSSSLREAGGMDEALLSSMDCLDLAARLQPVDGGGWLEPAASVTYHGTFPPPWDLRLYLSRWSRATVEHDMARFRSQWRLAEDDDRVNVHWYAIGSRRWRLTRAPRALVRRVLGERAVTAFDRPIDALIDRFSPVSRPQHRQGPGSTTQ